MDDFIVPFIYLYKSLYTIQLEKIEDKTMSKQVKRVPIQLHIPIISDKQLDCPYKEPFGYIYKITNIINGHYYIGQHEFHHPWLDQSYKGSGEALWRAYKKYGMENFDIVILEWIENDGNKLNEQEIYWIDMFGSYRFTFHYNLTEGGMGWTSEVSKYHWTESRKKSQSKWMSTELNPAYMEGTKDKQSNSLKKFISSHPEVRQFRSETAKKMWESKSHRDKVSNIMMGSNNPFYGKGYTQYGGKNHSARQVVQLTMNREFVRLYECMEDTRRIGGFNPLGVSECCKGNYTHHKGYRWVYKEDYDKSNSDE